MASIPPLEASYAVNARWARVAPRRHVDNHTGAFPGHDVGGVMAAEPGSYEVDLNDLTEPSFVGFEDMPHRADEAGIVDQDIDGAECLDRGVEHLTHLGRIGYVGDYRYGRSAGIFDGRGGFSRSLPIDVVHHDVRSSDPKSLGNGPADAPAGPRDHGNLTFM